MKDIIFTRLAVIGDKFLLFLSLDSFNHITVTNKMGLQRLYKLPKTFSAEGYENFKNPRVFWTAQLVYYKYALVTQIVGYKVQEHSAFKIST